MVVVGLGLIAISIVGMVYVLYWARLRDKELELGARPPMAELQKIDSRSLAAIGKTELLEKALRENLKNAEERFTVIEKRITDTNNKLAGAKPGELRSIDKWKR